MESRIRHTVITSKLFVVVAVVPFTKKAEDNDRSILVKKIMMVLVMLELRCL